MREAVAITPLTLQQCAVHTITTKPWPIETAIDAYARIGFGGISIWRDAMDGRNPAAIRRQLRDAQLSGVSLVRGGFIAHQDESAQRRALEDNHRCIAEAADLELPLIVLVCGADPAWSLEESRQRITEALVTLAPEAKAAGVRLGIEPLHPMYADTRSAINTLHQANTIAKGVNSEVGSTTVVSVVDVYHLWWDPDLGRDIATAGAEGILGAYHVCDWRVPTEHMLLDRGLMGEGCIPLHRIRQEVERAQGTGERIFTEVEIFSERYWNMDQAEWLQMVATACTTYA